MTKNAQPPRARGFTKDAKAAPAQAAPAAETVEDTSKAVALPGAENSSSVMPISLETMADELEGLANAGFEDIKSTDVALPVWKLLQSNSPEVKRNGDAYVRGAKEGMWLDTIAQEAYDRILVAPVRYQLRYIEWQPRNQDGSGGGFVMDHGMDPSVMGRTKRNPETRKDMTRDGTEIIPTGTLYGIVLAGVRYAYDKNDERDPDHDETRHFARRGVLTMSSTQLKVARRWMTDAQAIEITNERTGNTFRPPMFAMTYAVDSIGQTRDKLSWNLTRVTKAGWILDYPHGMRLFNACKEYLDFSKSAALNFVRDDEQANIPDDGKTIDGSAQRHDDGYAEQRDGGRRHADDDIPF